MNKCAWKLLGWNLQLCETLIQLFKSLLFHLKAFKCSNLYGTCITSAIYLVTSVMFRHNKTSRRSPQPPFPFRIFCFLITLATVSIRFFGYNWPALVATLITCCTFEITWFDSQLFFLWWTPLWKKTKKRRLIERGFREALSFLYHSPMWKTLGPRTTIAKSFFFRHWWLVCWSDQSLWKRDWLKEGLSKRINEFIPIVIIIVTEILCARLDLVPCWAIEWHAHVVLAANPWRYFNLETKPRNFRVFKLSHNILRKQKLKCWIVR